MKWASRGLNEKLGGLRQAANPSPGKAWDECTRYLDLQPFLISNFSFPIYIV